jgi:hypothetical protein
MHLSARQSKASKSPSHDEASRSLNRPVPSNHPLDHPLLKLQRAIGNQSTERLLRARLEGSASVPPIVYEALQSPSQPLDPSTRASLEGRLGHDFGQVRVHTDAKAAESARAVGAQAYTVGNSVVFGAGQYAPQTISGRQLLAHELSHTMQQRIAPATIPDPLVMGAPDNQLEHEADAAAAAARRGTVLAALRLSAVAPLLQRQSQRNVLITRGFRVVPPAEEGMGPPVVSKEATDPRTDSDYVDQRITGVGFTLRQPGYLLFLEDSVQVFVPDRLVRGALKNASSVSSFIYPNYDSALAAIPQGPWRPEDAVPYAYYRAPGLPSLIVPTVFSPATTPRTVELMREAVKKYSTYVVSQLEDVQKLVVLMGAARLLLVGAARLGTRLGGGGRPPPEPAPSPSREPAPPETAPPPTRGPAPPKSASIETRAYIPRRFGQTDVNEEIPPQRLLEVSSAVDASEFPGAAKLWSEGLPGRGTNRNLWEHMQGANDTAFRGSTRLPGQAAEWCSEGDVVVRIERVDAWDVNTAALRIEKPTGFTGNPMRGENEWAIEAAVPPAKIRDFAVKKADGRLGPWIKNPNKGE